MFFTRFIPREEKFFDLFNELANCLVRGAQEFHEMLANLSQSEARSRKIKNIEHEADDITHKTVELLHKTFITPFDHNDIHNLVCKMDDILDFLEASSQRIFLYQLKTPPPQAKELSEICLKSAELIQKSVAGLGSLKKTHKEISTHCVEINRLENDADHLLRSSVATLFQKESDIKTLIMHKEICELLETVTDRCEDVANILEGIVLEYS